MAEVLIAVVIVAIMFVSLYGGVSFGFAVTESSRQELRATQIIMERMEGIRLFNWNQITDTNLNPAKFTREYYPLALAGQSKGITYTGAVTVATVPLDPPATYSNDMKRVTVSLNWVSGRVPRSRTMSTYVSKNGIQNYIFGADPASGP
jgi:Tfp pilus assembly protein PilV